MRVARLPLFVVLCACANLPKPRKAVEIPQSSATDASTPASPASPAQEPQPGTPETPQPAAPLVDCPIAFRFDAKGAAYQHVYVSGEFNAWAADTLELTDQDGDFVFDGQFTIKGLQPGRFAYKLVLVAAGQGPQWVLDPENTRQKVLGGQVNSRVDFKDCHVPVLSLASTSLDQNGVATVVVDVQHGLAQDSFDPTSLAAKTTQGDALPIVLSLDKKQATVTVSGHANTKVGVWVSAGGPHGDAEPLYVPVWTRTADAFSWEKSTLYFAFTDRFSDGNATNDAPSSCLPSTSLANWLGGDFAGITQKIKDGYFDALSVDAVWISSPTLNPAGCYPGSLGRNYTAYHAYFPKEIAEVDPHFGTEDELRELVEAAHARGIRVLIDYVANHLHEESPLVPLHPDWFHPYYLCGWDQPIVCWFEPYLPDINYDVDAADQAMADAALHWIQHFDLDGFRVDAAKHIGHPFIHNLRAEIAEKVEHRPLIDQPPKATPFYMVGETFTGGWSPSDSSQVDMIREWISLAELDGQFDFPLWYQILYTFGKQNAPTGALKTLLQAKIDYGSVWAAGSPETPAVMSAFIDNHDVPRFISHADNLVNGYAVLDDTSSDAAKTIGWDPALRPAQPSREEPYKMAQIAYAFLLSQAAIPMVYYGDEIGLPGAGDPDNRRPMQFSGLSANQAALLARYQALGKLRKAHPALSSNALEMSGLLAAQAAAQDDTLVYFKLDPSEEILVVIDRRHDLQTDTLQLSMPARVPAGAKYRDLETNETFTSTAGRLDVPVRRPNARYLLRVTP
jgi:glycosidase